MSVEPELYMQQANCRLMVWGKEWFKLFIMGPSNLICSPLSPPMTTAMPSMRKIEETARWVAMTRTTEQSRTPDSASLSSSLRTSAGGTIAKRKRVTAKWGFCQGKIVYGVTNPRTFVLTDVQCTLAVQYVPTMVQTLRIGGVNLQLCRSEYRPSNSTTRPPQTAAALQPQSCEHGESMCARRQNVASAFGGRVVRCGNGAVGKAEFRDGFLPLSGIHWTLRALNRRVIDNVHADSEVPRTRFNLPQHLNTQTIEFEDIFRQWDLN
ncbi:hypothetical protein BGW80DRAFT_1520259 [Lactifluus volemus]|nr:hypothetical protein BGW80DRAFT_1520259 [Lactifluus volemus]